MDSDEAIENLVSTLALEPIEVNLFRGRTSGRDGKRIFGGHVIAQALMAAYETVEARACHSLHCYFIRAGDPATPILYDVDRARDGTSFTTRRVRAIQHGRQIFNLAASFHGTETGLEHQSAMPEAAAPEGLVDAFEELKLVLADRPDQHYRIAGGPPPIERRSATPRKPDEVSPSTSHVWMRARAPIGPDQHLHQALLAYASDIGFLETCLRPHGLNWQSPGLQSASLDHAVWFHRPFDFNDWVLYDQESPITHGARGFARGQVFTRDGVLVASVTQEALFRMRP